METPVALLVAVTVALGMAAPVESTTVPWIPASPPVCERSARGETESAKHMIKAKRRRRPVRLCCLEREIAHKSRVEMFGWYMKPPNAGNPIICCLLQFWKICKPNNNCQ